MPADPLDRFKQALESVSATAAPPVAQSQIKQLLEGDGTTIAQLKTNPELHKAAVEHLTNNSALTQSAATAVVKNAVATSATTGDAAAAIANAANAASVNAKVSLSDPVMLDGTGRAAFASFFTAFAVAAGVALYLLSIRSNVSTAGLVTLSVFAGICILAVLILVMGYKSVTIEGGTGGQSSDSSGGSSSS